MIPSEIKKIAEEYADACSVPLDFRTNPHYAGLAQEAEDVLNFLAARFYLVEKGKVEEKRATWSNGLKSFPESQAHKSVLATLNAIFGSEIGKEDGNE